MDKRFFRRCARNAAFSLLGCLLLAAPAFAAQEITVSGAASLTNAFTEIKGLFEKKYPDIKVHTNFAASNPLLKQMEEGAPVDVFASADQETMDKAAARSWSIPPPAKISRSTISSWSFLPTASST